LQEGVRLRLKRKTYYKPQHDTITYIRVVLQFEFKGRSDTDYLFNYNNIAERG